MSNSSFCDWVTIMILWIWEALFRSQLKLAALVPAAVLLQWFLQRKFGEKSVLHGMGVVLFSAYFVWAFIITGVPTVTTFRWRPDCNFIPFLDFFSDFVQYLQNALLFLPIGFLYSLLWRKNATVLRVACFCFGLSLFVELSQLFSLRICDINDLMMNTAGGVLGWLLFWLMHRVVPGFVRRCRLVGNRPSRLLGWEDWMCLLLSLLCYVFIPG